MKVGTWFAAALLAAQAFSVQAAAPEVIRIGVSGVGTGNRPITGGSTFALVHIDGLLEEEFEKDGIKVEWNFFQGAGPAANEALANGLLDLISQGDLPSLVARSSGLRTRIILPQSRNGRAYLAVPSDSRAKSLADLKGKRLAVFKGTATQLTLNRVLEKEGFVESDFRTVTMNNAATLAALASKDVDGAFLGTDVYSLIDRGVARIIYESDARTASTGHILVTEDFESKYPETVQRIVNVVVKAQAWVTDEGNREELFQRWSKSGTSYSAYRRSFEGQTLQDRLSPLFDPFFYAHYRDSLALAVKLKLVRGDVDIDRWLEPKYLKTALSSLELEGHWAEQDAAGTPLAAIGTAKRGAPSRAAGEAGAGSGEAGGAAGSSRDAGGAGASAAGAGGAAAASSNP